MSLGNDEADKIYEKWLPDYTERANIVEGELLQLFQEAISQEDPDSLVQNQGVSNSLTFLQKQREKFPHQLVLFIYSSRFDDLFLKDLIDKDLIDPLEMNAGLPDDLSQQEIYDHKADKLDRVIRAFALSTDVLANHYVVALMSKEKGPDLPLFLETPIYDEKETGFPADAMWWVTFQYLCEICRGIVAYVGITDHMYNELRYIGSQPHLKKRLLWLDQDMNLHSIDNDEEEWPVKDIATVLKKIGS